MIESIMSAETQEIIALAIVAITIICAAYARWRRPRKPTSACDNCASRPPVSGDEKPLHFYRRKS
jgi:hypothetical protein